MITTRAAYHRSQGLSLPTRPWYRWEELQMYAVPNFRHWTQFSENYLSTLEIIDSVTESGLSDLFVANYTSLDPDLSVALASTTPTSRDTITIAGGNGWAHSPAEGHVRIWHESFSGLIEDVERPRAEAVPLFWRFVAEKFAIVYLHKDQNP